MIRRIDLAAQYSAYADKIDGAISRVLRSGRYILGEEVSCFEAEFSAYLGGGETIALGDATRALTLALKALGVERGSEVITTSFTAIPTIGAVIDAGARPVLVDIDPETWLIDLKKTVDAVTPHTAAIIPVHMFGNVFDVPQLTAALPRRIPVVEDAAQAHGAMLGAGRAGTLGDMAAFSFYPSKNLGAYGDAGALVVRDRETAGRLRRVRNHGMMNKDVCAEPGINSRMDELQAAVLRAKLPHLDEMNQARVEIAERYERALPRRLFEPQRIAGDVRSNWHIYQCRYHGDRDELVRRLEELSVQSNIYYVVPHHLQPALTHLGYKAGDLPEVEALCKSAIALPMYPELEEAAQQKVIDCVLEAAG